MLQKRSINQSLNDIKRLEKRHQELINLLQRSVTEKEVLESTGSGKDRVTVTQVTKPVHDAWKLDDMVNEVAKAKRQLEDAIKLTNEKTDVIGWEFDDTLLDKPLPRL